MTQDLNEEYLELQRQFELAYLTSQQEAYWKEAAKSANDPFAKDVAAYLAGENEQQNTNKESK